MKLGGVDSCDQSHTMVVVVLKNKLFCKVLNLVESRIRFEVSTLLDPNLKLERKSQGWF